MNERPLWVTIRPMRIWLERLLTGVVTAWNLQAAFVFFFSPKLFTGAFELSGIAGEAALRGTGVLFLMWNVPYFAALLNPVRYRLALVLAVIMQFIGLAGEGYILSTLPAGHATLHASILRFIAFDGAGLVMLVTAYVMGSGLREISMRREQ